MNKYRNKKTFHRGILFDSIKESQRYQELLILQYKGYIEKLERQPKFLLQKSFTWNNTKYRAIYYKADFKYFEIEKEIWIVEDVKGFKTQVYELKKKIFIKQYCDDKLWFIET